MKRNILDINTPEKYDELFFGPRSHEMLAHPYVIKQLKDLKLPGQPILDIGCGLGRYFTAFDGCPIFGTELSTKCIEFIKNNYPNVNVQQWFAGTPLPFENNFFNLIWAGDILEHVENPQTFVKDIIRILQINGHALFSTPVENKIPCAEHLWYFSMTDIQTIFCNYKTQINICENGFKFNILVTKENYNE